jgi:predicted nucleotidyltransferase
MLDRHAIIEALGGGRERLREYPIAALYLFGSYARDEARDDSDVDILVEFEPGARVGLFGFARLQRLLTEIVGRRVDLATRDALHRALRDRILQEMIRAA